MATVAIQVLNGAGHLTLSWNPDDADETARIRAEVQHLADAGYSFFLTEEEPADAVAAGRGKLLVKRLDDPVRELAAAAAQHGDTQQATDFQESPGSDSAAAPPPDGRRRGRARAPQPDAQAVAVRPMRGG